MLTLLVYLEQVKAATEDKQFWPETGAGWVALVISLSTLLSLIIGGLWSYFKLVEQINGAGRRIGVLEIWKRTEEGRELEKTLDYERMVNAQNSLLEAIGRASAEASKCNEDTEIMGTRIEKKIDEFMTEVRKTDRVVSDRLMKLETMIDERTRQPTRNGL